jgi:hypothetical protein
MGMGTPSPEKGVLGEGGLVSIGYLQAASSQPRSESWNGHGHSEVALDAGTLTKKP